MPSVAELDRAAQRALAVAADQQRRVRQQITALLTVAAKWELPKDLLRRQAGREYERMVLELQSSGFTDAMIRQYMNELQQNALASTAKALKEHFILERIAEDQKIEAEPDDFDREVELIAEQSDESPRRVRARLEKRGLMDTLRNQIVERKVKPERLRQNDAGAREKWWQFIRPRPELNSAIRGLERVLAIDASWQQGSADRALGWWYHRVPGLFGGSEERAEQHLRRALTYNPQSTATLYFLAEVLLERGKREEGRAMLQRTLDAPLDPDWTPEDEDFKRKTRARLGELGR